MYRMNNQDLVGMKLPTNGIIWFYNAVKRPKDANDVSVSVLKNFKILDYL